MRLDATRELGDARREEGVNHRDREDCSGDHIEGFGGGARGELREQTVSS
jgi:hypothetical protein